ncbi:unnamed protein product [Fusarium equiseti]|uniref:Secreted protein n=1 Tax=Fusarium equiseti TaxID=61235 RepID=A0A8J2IWX2_FUSEQ|nr:unnamed protein product [Fusarium equiseti]
MFSNLSFVSLFLPALVAAVNTKPCGFSSRDLHHAFPNQARSLGARQTVSTCKLPSTDTYMSVGHGFQEDCVSGTGTIQGYMIFVDFIDAESPASESAKDLYNLLVPEAAEWYRNASYGQLELNITADVSRFYRMPKSAAAYGWEQGLSSEQHLSYIQDALDVYRSQGRNPMPAAHDVLYIATTRNNDKMTRSMATGFSVTARNGKFVSKRAITFGADPYTTWGYKALNHETGHTMCLPDYYPSAPDLPTGYYTGGWSIMGNVGGAAPDFFAWDKWRLGWLKDTAINCVTKRGTTQHTLTAVEVEGGVKAVVIAASQTSAIVAEARVAKGVDGRICAPGVLLYSIDTTVTTSAGSIKVLDTTPGSNGCGENGELEPLNDATLSMKWKKSFEVSEWGVKVTLVEENKNGQFMIEVEYS